MKILCIDDDKLILNFYRVILKTFIYDSEKLYFAETGNEGVDKCLEINPDIVLLDYHLPDIPGIEVLKKIKSFNKKIKVIVITGRSSIETAVECMREGASDYLEKPIDKTIIEKKVTFLADTVMKDKFIEDQLFARDLNDEKTGETINDLELGLYNLKNNIKSILSDTEHSEKEKLVSIENLLKK